MKKMFLSSSFADVVDLFDQFTKGKYKGKTITFIPTASLPEKVKFYVGAGKRALQKMGLVVVELEISTATKEEISSILHSNDAIYITGGNTFFLLQELKRTGADKIIVKQIKAGKLYVGESAGSIILSPNVEYVKDMDDVQAAPILESFSGLDLVDFYPVPHHTNSPFKKVVEKIISNYGEKMNLCPISNAQAIVVNGKNVEVRGK
jgi:dipeptidase E